MQGGEELAQRQGTSVASGLMLRLGEIGLRTGALSLLLKRKAGSAANRAARAAELTSKSASAVDELSKRAATAASTLKRRARPENLGHDYRSILHLTQEASLDRAIERLFFKPTKGRTALDKLTISSPNRRFGHAYYPVHRLSLNWALSQLDERLDEFTFVDYGAGRGRALLLAAMHPFRRVVGVEFASELHDDASMNIAQFPRSQMKCRKVECQLMDAVDFPIPNEKCVMLFNNPFNDEVMKTVLARITASYRAHPRRMYLVFIRPSRAETLDHLMELAVVFEPLCHSRAQHMRLQLLSADQIQIFKTLI